MIYWLIIAVLVVAIIFLVEVKHMKYRIYAILIVLALMFLFVSFMNVAKSNDFELDSAEAVFDAVKVYFVWLGQGLSNVKVLVGNALKMDWAPQNKTDEEI